MFDNNDKINVNSLYTDFRSDVVAAGMVDNGFDADRIIMLRRNGKTRATDKDVAGIDYIPDADGKGEGGIQIRTGRSGMYDHLPEALFHSGPGLGNYNQDSILEALRRQHGEEALARKFFSLYEAEIDHHRISINLTELEYDSPGKHRTFVDTLSRFWPVLRLMDYRTAILFCRTLPHIHRIRNSYTQIASAISLITGYSAKIKLRRKEITLPVKNPRLGSMKLGNTSTLCGRLTEDYAVVEVEAPVETTRNLLPGTSGRFIFDSLLEEMMPVCMPYETVLRQRPEVSVSRLGDRTHPCLLGVNAKLKKKEKGKETII
jgi:hypothetical protein